MIASRDLIQAQAGLAAVVTAVFREVPGVSEMASLAGRCGIIIPAGRRETAGLARPVPSRAWASGGPRAMSRPVVHG